jgi:hypothetical protein
MVGAGNGAGVMMIGGAIGARVGTGVTVRFNIVASPDSNSWLSFAI